MAANINDKFTQGTNGTRPVPDTLTAIKAIGAPSISCGALTGWPTATAVHFSIYNIDTSGNKVANSQTDWKGVVSGTTITNLTLMAGTDNGYAVGAVVEAGPTAMWAKDMADGMIAEHEQDGTHGAITPTSVNTGAITATSITTSSLTISGSASSEGWAAVGDNPDTITYNGYRNYDLVFNSNDLTDTLSPGMKLRFTRTVAAPDQCADLEASSSQYFSKSSPAGMTFTDDFVVSAWVKLESYTAGTIVSRYNGTSGWYFDVNSSGQLRLVGLNAGAANYSLVQSYASLPLNKWVHVSAQLDMSTFTATSSTSYIMFDGVDTAASVSRSGTNPTALVQAGNLEIGSANATTFFDGKIAQVAIFNAKVTQANMRGYMSQGLSGSETSLISAYSFDNAITDLNTTNANNLTANAGAAATNSDSPFANAVSAGLQEYCEINAVSFSTNTTVNVRVPDTCMIPTSGGISASYYAVGAYPYGLPYFSNVLGEAKIAYAASTSSTSSVAVDGLTATFYVPTGAKVKLCFHAYGIRNSTAGNSVITQVYIDSIATANARAGGQTTSYSNLVAATINAEEAVTLAPGLHTAIFGWACSPGGTATMVTGAPQAMPTVWVELV